MLIWKNKCLVKIYGTALSPLEKEKENEVSKCRRLIVGGKKIFLSGLRSNDEFRWRRTLLLFVLY